MGMEGIRIPWDVGTDGTTRASPRNRIGAEVDGVSVPLNLKVLIDSVRGSPPIPDGPSISFSTHP